jgi:HEPN domain-containing protein
MGDKSEYWLDLAEYDLETAQAMNTAGRFLYVGFMCHQVAEKSLKAIIAKSGAMPPKTHALIQLIELCGLSVSLSAEQKNLLNELLPLNIEARYPSHKEQLLTALNKNYCADLLNRTEGFLQWIKKQL